jgi:acyl dehydratase
VHQLTWDDFTPGSASEYGPRVLTREEIMAFAAEFDPQPMHLDEDAARASMLGGLAASGWHSCCVLMRMVSDGFLRDTRFLGAPGIEEVRWLAPVRPGEPLTVRATVLEKRASQSRPGMGFFKFLFELINPSGKQLMTLTVNPMFARRADSTTTDAAPNSP